MARVVRAIVGLCLIAGVTGSIAFAACATGPGSTPAPPASSVATPAPTARDAGSDGFAEHAKAAQSCSDPLPVVLNEPDGGVVFHNAMTSADAGHLDRADEVVLAVAAQGARFRCCFDAWMRSQAERRTAEVMLQVQLSAEGRVTDAGVDPARSDVRDALTTACLVSVVSEVDYPASPRKMATLIEYPLKVGVEGR